MKYAHLKYSAEDRAMLRAKPMLDSVRAAGDKVREAIDSLAAPAPAGLVERR